MRYAMIVLVGLATLEFFAVEARAAGRLLLTVVDSKTDTPIPFRFHLKNEKGIPVKVPKLPFWHDHVVVATGSVQLELFRGNYFFEIEHGPEYQTSSGYFTINNGADDDKVVPLKQVVDMAARDWWAGDLDVRRSVPEVESAMQAEGMTMVPITTWSNRKNDWTKTKPPSVPWQRFDGSRFYQQMAGLEDRSGGPVALFGLNSPTPLDGSKLGLKSSDASLPLTPLIPQLGELRSASPELWLDVAHPAAWDLPILLAQGDVDSYRVLPALFQRDKVDTAWQGRPLDKAKYDGADGPARFAQDVYFHILNCGLRVVPSAGSGSGTVGNPIGYNRVYVAVDKKKLGYESWWEQYKAGAAVVTNGPLLQPRANDRKPGYIFTGTEGSVQAFEIAMDLGTRDPIDYVEVVQDGKAEYRVPLKDWAKAGGRFPPVAFRNSGWFLVRAVCTNPKTYRMAMSAPWYVDFDGKPRVSKRSAEFFLAWLEERAAQLKLGDPQAREVAEKQIDEARAFWRKKIEEANSP